VKNKNKRVGNTMGKFDGFLFCTDLDGTLYRNDKTVSKENLEAIEYFKSEGGLFTFITGRVPKTSISICETIKPNAPYGCINGGGIFDAEKNEYLWSMPLADGVKELIDTVSKELPQVAIQANTKNDIFFLKDNSAMVRFRKVTGAPNIKKTFDEINEPILKIVFADENENTILQVEKLLNNHPFADKFDFIRSERRLYEILPKGVSKGKLLLKLAELLKIDPNKTIAVGDYNNDISMIESAGIGYAVANANQAVKAVADRITVSNEEHAIATIIKKLER
jgi:Cof subfamily protein (haloacid dehalogenase superfamily)